MFGYTQSPGCIRRGNIWQSSGGNITHAYNWDYGLYTAYPYSTTNSKNNVTGFYSGNQSYTTKNNIGIVSSSEFSEIEYINEDRNKELLCSFDIFRAGKKVNVKARPFHTRLSQYSLYQDSCAVYVDHQNIAVPFPYRFYGYIDRGGSSVSGAQYTEIDVREKYSVVKEKVNRSLSIFKPAKGKATHSADVIQTNEIYTPQEADFSLLSKSVVYPIYKDANPLGEYNAMLYDYPVLESYQMKLCIGYLDAFMTSLSLHFYVSERDKTFIPLVQCIPPYLKQDGVYFPKMKISERFTTAPSYNYTFEYTPTEKQDPSPYNIINLSSVASDYNNYMEYIINSSIQSVPVDYAIVMAQSGLMCWYGIHGILQPFVNAV